MNKIPNSKFIPNGYPLTENELMELATVTDKDISKSLVKTDTILLSYLNAKDANSIE